MSSWRGKNNSGGRLAVGDWHDIALNGRRVILAFDGDVSRKPAVRQALSALADYLSGKGAYVEYLRLPDTDAKTGLDDFLVEHTVDELWRLVKPTQPPEPTEPMGTSATQPHIRSVTSQLVDMAREHYTRAENLCHVPNRGGVAAVS